MLSRIKILAAALLVATTAACTGPGVHPRTCEKPPFTLSSKNVTENSSAVCRLQLASDRRPVHDGDDNDEGFFGQNRERNAQKSSRPADSGSKPSIAAAVSDDDHRDLGRSPGSSGGPSSEPSTDGPTRDPGRSPGSSSGPNSEPSTDGPARDIGRSPGSSGGPSSEPSTDGPTAVDTAADIGAAGNAGSDASSGSAPNKTVSSVDADTGSSTDAGSSVGGATVEAGGTSNRGKSPDRESPGENGRGNQEKNGGGSSSNNGSGNGSEGASPGKGDKANNDEG